MPTITIKGKEIRRGQILKIHGGTTTVRVEEIKSGAQAVQVRDMGGRWYGLDREESVQLVGHFNPE